jgi:hypothetical protein
MADLEARPVPRYPEWFREDFAALIQLLREGKTTQSWPTACRWPRRGMRTSCWRARRRRESSC